MSAYLALTVTDTPGLWLVASPPVQPAPSTTRTIWYRLPDDWVSRGQLRPNRRDLLLDALYGAGRHRVDAPHLILELDERVLTAEEAQDRPWLADETACYAWSADDRVAAVAPARF